MTVSNRTRFEVFKRDGFACQYCGLRAPQAILEVDHIHPVSQGGANEAENLLTACFACNRGKAAREVLQTPRFALVIATGDEIVTLLIAAASGIDLARIRGPHPLTDAEWERIDAQADNINSVMRYAKEMLEVVD